jgi:NADPH-dependent 2,4-dienoyl-CoA reductase/sulfur reductase-like enzyme
VHAGTFDVRSGDLLESPPLDALPTFPVRIVGADIFVGRPDGAKDSRLMPMCHGEAAADSRLFVITGGGAAAAAAAETLRQKSYRGRIVMISSEGRWPYDRPKLSKDYVAGSVQAKWLPLRTPEFYAEYGIEREYGRVTSLDVRSRVITMQDGSTLEPDGVLIATGGTPRKLNVLGTDLPGVFTLRSWSDCDALIAAAQNAGRVVVIGASFIGMEVAAGLAQRGLEVTVVGHGATPFEATLGKPVSTLIRRHHEAHGTRFAMGHGVARFGGENRIETVELGDGTTLQADLVVVGIGVQPATEFVRGVELDPDGGLPVDKKLSVAPGAWAAGDVRIEHWRLAEQHGRAAAKAMLGGRQPFAGVPFFWTQQFEREIYYAGAEQGWDEMFVSGDIQAWEFTAFYSRDDRLVAACGTQSSEIGAFIELMRAGKLPPIDSLSDGMRPGLSALI